MMAFRQADDEPKKRPSCADDGRGVNVAVTAAGGGIRTHIWPAYAKAITDAAGRNLGDREAVQIENLLLRLADTTARYLYISRFRPDD